MLVDVAELSLSNGIRKRSNASPSLLDDPTLFIESKEGLNCPGKARGSVEFGSFH